MARLVSKPNENKGRDSSSSGASYDDMGIHPERREAEADDLERLYGAPSAQQSNQPTKRYTRNPSQPVYDDQGEAQSDDKNPSKKGTKNRNKLSPGEISDAEKSDKQSSSSDDKEQSDINKLVQQTGDKKQKSKRQFFLKKKKAIGFGVVGLLIGGGAGFMILFAPILKLDSYLSSINDRVFTFAAGAMESRLEYLFDRYMISHILSLENCHSTRSTDCRADYSDKGIAATLFNQWRDVKLENKIMANYGFSVQSTDRSSSPDGIHRFTLIDTRGKKITFDRGEEGWSKFKNGDYTGGKHELGREIRRFVGQETRWYQVLHRRSVRNYLKRKHNIKFWCFMACKTRDEADRKYKDSKSKYKIKFIERFVYPVAPKYGFVMTCLASGGTKCSKAEADKHPVVRDRIPDDKLEELIDNLGEGGSANKRFSTVVLDQVVKRVITNEATRRSTQAAIGAIPLVGQVWLGLTVLDLIERADSFVDNNGLSKMAAEINSAQYLEWYVAMRTAGDELKTHSLSLEDARAITDDFAGAESSRVFQARYGIGNYDKYRDQDTSYTCQNGQPIPKYEYVCEEKKIRRSYRVEEMRDNKVFSAFINQGLRGYRNCYGPEVDGFCTTGLRPKTLYRKVAGAIDKIVDTVLGPIVKRAIEEASGWPGIGSFINFLTEQATALVESFFRNIFPFPIDENSKGREKYDGLEAGGELTAFEFCQGGYTEKGNQEYGIGCRRLNQAEAAKVQQEYLEQQKYEFYRKSFLARLTDLNYPKSLASQAIAIMPSSAGGLLNNFVGSFSGFIGSFGTNTLSFAFKPALAAEDPIGPSPFGLPKYGYPVDDPDLRRPPEDYTEEYCEEVKKEWNESKTEDPLTGFDEYSKTNPCLLELVTVEAGGLFFTNE